MKWKKKKKFLKSLRPSKELEQYEENFNLIHKRNISTTLKKDEKKEKDIHYLEKKLEKRFDKIDDNIEEMKISINNLFLLSVLKENIPEEKNKNRIRDYIERYYKKLLPNLFKGPPISKTDEYEDEKEINISNQNDNNNIISQKKNCNFRPN
jgi:hypothetical protein